MSALVNLGGWATEGSFLRRCDPRFKVVCTLAAMVVCFRITGVTGALLALALVGALCALGRIRPGRLLRAVWPLLVMLVVVSALNLLVTQTGNVVASWGPVTITTGGVETFALYSVRLATLLCFGTLLMATTDPLALTNALASLLSPLKALRVPVEQLAMVLALALRFVPTLADEAQSVMDAQRCRGVSFDRGSLGQRVHALAALAVPVMTGALRHADTLSLALEARAYDPSQPRTRWHQPHPGWRDAVLCAVTAAFVACVVLWG